MKKLCIICMSLMIAIAVKAQEWTLVTDAATLQAGDQIVLAYTDKGHTAGLTITSGGTKALEAAISTFEGTAITDLGTNTAVFTLGGQAGAWTLTNQNGETLGATALKQLSWTRGTTTWTISIVGGQATMNSTNSEYGQMQYNAQYSRFCNYKAGGTMKPIEIYRSGSAAEKFALTYQGFLYKKTKCEDPTYAAGSKVRLSSGTKQREDGLWISGWEYQGVAYKLGAEFTMPEADVELTPVWGEKPQAIGNVQSDKAQWTKVIRNGQLIIIRDNVEYNILGGRLQ